MTIIPGAVVDDAEVKIILPEGAMWVVCDFFWFLIHCWYFQWRGIFSPFPCPFWLAFNTHNLPWYHWPAGTDIQVQ
jgi:hypothetical protein